MNIHTDQAVSFDQADQFKSLSKAFVRAGNSGWESGGWKKIEVKPNWQAMGLELLLNPDLAGN